jgi:hypothetical protein
VEKGRVNAWCTGVVSGVCCELGRVVGFPLIWGDEGWLGGLGALVEGAPEFGGLGS